MSQGGRDATGEKSDKAKGKAKEAAGATREKTGDALGNEEMEAKGKAQKGEGKAEQTKGKVKGAAKDVIDG